MPQTSDLSPQAVGEYPGLNTKYPAGSSGVNHQINTWMRQVFLTIIRLPGKIPLNYPVVFDDSLEFLRRGNPKQIKINGIYQMSDWKETIFRDSPPPQKCTSISAPGTFSGPFMGSAHSHYMLAYITADTGLFYGFTFFDGTLGTRKGSFVLSDQGVFDTNAATTRWNIVAGSGINDFAGISGSGGFSATEGLKVSFELEFELPA